MTIVFNCLTIVAMKVNKRTSETIGQCCAEVQVHPQGVSVGGREGAVHYLHDEIDQCAPQQKISRQTDTTQEKQMLWQYSSNRADGIPRKAQFGNWR